MIEVSTSFFTQDKTVKLGGVFFMQNELLDHEKKSIFSLGYWKEAAAQFKSTKMIVFAALIIALRIAVKFFKIQLAPNLSLSFDGYVNALGSMVYGPAVGLVVGAISDTIGCIVKPTGDYFLPFILTEMLSSFIFGLFFWNRKIGLTRTIGAKFTVNLICNIILTSILTKWMYFVFYGIEKAEAYNLINGVRIVKNLILFPLEALLIVFVLSAAMPALRSTKLVRREFAYIEKPNTLLLWVQIIAYTLFSVALILFYVFFLKDFISTHNFKLW